MSVITDAVILTGADDADFQEDAVYGAPLPIGIAFINERLAAEDVVARGGGFVSVRARAGGTKVFCSGCYAAALNHCGPDELVELVKAAPWRSPAEVRLLVHHETEEYEGWRVAWSGGGGPGTDD